MKTYMWALLLLLGVPTLSAAAQNFTTPPAKGGGCDPRTCGEYANCLADGGGADISISPHQVEVGDIITVTATPDGRYDFQGMNWPASPGLHWQNENYCSGPGSLPGLERVGACPFGAESCDYRVTSAGSMEEDPDLGGRPWAIMRLYFSVGCCTAWDEDYFGVTVPKEPPEAVFAWEQGAGFHVTFDAAASSDPDGEIVSYDWDFGDNETELGVQTSHTYQAYGTYPVRLKVTDNDDLEDEVTHEIKAGKAEMSFTMMVEPDTVSVEETVQVRLIIKNTGDALLSEIGPDGEITMETREDGAMDLKQAPDPAFLAALEPSQSDTLTWVYKATATGGVAFSVASVQGEDPEGEAIEATPDCTASKNGTVTSCTADVWIRGPVLAVNSTDDDPKDPSTSDCDTGETIARDGKDEPECTLRAAIETLNERASAGSITFNIPGTGPHTITVASTLPKITPAVEIDGTTQEGGIKISAGEGVTGDGLVLDGKGSMVKGLNIAGFAGGGAGLVLAGAGGHSVEECFLGLDANDQGTAGNGVGIRVASDGNTIGGEDEGQGNKVSVSVGAGIRITSTVTEALISGNELYANQGAGILIDGNGGSSNTLRIEGNRTHDNAGGGILVTNRGGVSIGGVGEAPGKPPGNMFEDGLILQDAKNLRLRGNRITNKQADLEMGAALVIRRGQGTVVGGPNDEGNLVGNSQGDGIVIDEASQTRIEGNLIGTDSRQALPNENGIVDRGSDTYILDNHISGNRALGILIEHDAESVTRVEGNVIGLDDIGEFALPNGKHGIEVKQGIVKIGGNRAGEACETPCNLISGNAEDGIFFHGTDSDFSEVLGNFIGVTDDGQRPEGNGGSGIVAQAKMTIGGPSNAYLSTCNGPCNIIAGNSRDGIRTFTTGDEVLQINRDVSALAINGGGAEGLVVQGNYIGRGLLSPESPAGSGLGNGANGIALGAGTTGSLIGGTGSNSGNVIVRNGGAGVLVAPGFDEDLGVGVFGEGNTIRKNRIFLNRGLAIDISGTWLLTESSGTSLDPGVTDPDEDGEQPNAATAPVFLLGAQEGAGTVQLTWIWRGDADTTPGDYLIDYYASPYCTGFTGDAYTPVYSEVRQLPLAESPFVTNVPQSPGSPYFTATATAPDGSTSELFNCIAIGTEAVAVPLIDGATAEGPGMQVTPTVNGAQGKTAVDLGVLYVTRHDTAPGGTFLESSAKTPSGAVIIPQSTRGGYWQLGVAGQEDPMSYELCLDASALTEADANETIVLLRNAATGGLWQPHDTYLETRGATRYACTDGLSSFGDGALGSGQGISMAAPVLQTPEEGSTHVIIGTALIWEAVPEASFYEVQVALHISFAASLIDTSGVIGTSLPLVGLLRGRLHYGRVRGVTATGTAGPWSVPRRFTTSATEVAVEDEAEMPDEVVLYANYPNPFNPQTTLAFELPQTGPVRLAVYDMIGREIALLVDGTFPAGQHETVFDAAGLPSGVYLYRLQAHNQTRTRMMMLLK